MQHGNPGSKPKGLEFVSFLKFSRGRIEGGQQFLPKVVNSLMYAPLQQTRKEYPGVTHSSE